VPSGGIVYVKNSEINDDITINKSIRFIGVKSNESKPKINGMITINSSNILIDGFEIYAVNSRYGITTHLKEEHDSNTNIWEPTTKSSPEPYYENITISNNTINGSLFDGISLVHSKNISILSNILNAQEKIGLRLSDCLNVTIFQNEIKTRDDYLSRPSKSNICLGGCTNVSLNDNIVPRSILIHNFGSENMSFCNNSCGNTDCKIADFSYSLTFVKRSFDYDRGTQAEVDNRCE
jgi:parallel beta-helix repeat protein